MLKISSLMLAAALLCASPASAAPASSAPAMSGIWAGNVGSLPVRACFVERDQRIFGAYYYLSHLRLITLSPDEGVIDSFHEGGGDGVGAPRWQFENAASDRLAGRWTSGGRTLAVELHKIGSGEGQSGACADLEFHRPRFAGLRVARRRAAKDGVAFTRLALDTSGHFGVTVETFALDGDSPEVRRLNETLGASLAGDPPPWFDCISDSLDQSAFEGSFDDHLQPELISRRWLAVTHRHESYCGNAHPNAGTIYRTFDRTSGRELDLHDWLNSIAVSREPEVEGVDHSETLQADFRDAILDGWRAEDPQCEEVVRGQSYWNIGLTRDALVFTPSLPHVAQACAEGFRMTFAALEPYLTHEGSEHVRALQSERPAQAARR